MDERSYKTKVEDSTQPEAFLASSDKDHHSSGEHGLKENSKESTKKALLKSARTLFADHGFAATSVKQISEHAGVNISLISYHFGGKENLYKACLESELLEASSFFEKIISSPCTNIEDFKVRMRLLLEELIQQDIKNPEVSRIIRRDIELGTVDQALFDVFKKSVISIFGKFVQFIKMGQEQGLLRTDISPNHMATLFMGSIQHVLRTDRLRKMLFNLSIHDEKEKNSIIDATLTMFFFGYINNKGDLS